MPSTYLTPRLSCEPRFCMFIINGYCTKSKCLQSLDSLLKDVIVCCVFFNQTGNTLDKTVQWQHLNQYIKFIYIENVIRLVLFIVLLLPPKKFFDQWFFYFSFHGDQQRDNIYLQCWCIYFYIHQRKYQAQPHSLPCFSVACAAAVAHGSHFCQFQGKNPNVQQ